MSYISSIFLPALEKELINSTPEIAAYLIKNSGALAVDIIKFVESKFHGEKHGEKMDSKSD